MGDLAQEHGAHDISDIAMFGAKCLVVQGRAFKRAPLLSLPLTMLRAESVEKSRLFRCSGAGVI